VPYTRFQGLYVEPLHSRLGIPHRFCDFADRSECECVSRVRIPETVLWKFDFHVAGELPPFDVQVIITTSDYWTSASQRSQNRSGLVVRAERIACGREIWFDWRRRGGRR
jgi:hypothetical protein